MPDGIDHRLMVPPFLRIADSRRTPSGDAMVVWDLRIAQPNVTHVPTPALHSLEHLLATHLKRRDTSVLNVGVMGCQTGLYINAWTDSFLRMASLLESALSAVKDAEAVPLANPRECGWAEHHSLEGAQAIAAWLNSTRSQWNDPYGAGGVHTSPRK